MTGVSHDWYLPTPPIPPGHTPESWLRESAFRGVSSRYGNQEQPELLTRIERELAVIRALKCAHYMLIVAEYVNWAKHAGIWVSPGRGAVAGSAVAYALGITEVDPMRHGLLFERFLNTDAPTLPDIDLDFEWGRRSEVVEHIVLTYGKEAVAGITNRVENRPVHAAAVLIANRPLSEIVPVSEMPRTDRNVWLSAVELCADRDYKECADHGLAKFDLLALRDLRSLRRIVAAVERRHGMTIMPWSEDLPLDDPSTYQLLSAGDTNEVFQLGSPPIQRYLRELQPERFQEVAALLALCRTKAMGRGHHLAYFDRRHGRGTAATIHPELDRTVAPILEPTHGVLVYQEQMMEISQEFSGMSLGQADRLRRSIGRAQPSEVAMSRDKFSAGLEANDYSTQAADALWTWLCDSNEYAFNKAHAVSYALIAYWGAYLKANFPDEFHEGVNAG